MNAYKADGSPLRYGIENPPTMLNQILSFERMFKTIRSKEGLTYSPWGDYGAQYDYPGVFSCGTQTKSKSTVRAIRLMLAEVDRITKEESARVRNRLQNDLGEEFGVDFVGDRWTDIE